MNEKREKQGHYNFTCLVSSLEGDDFNFLSSSVSSGSAAVREVLTLEGEMKMWVKVLRSGCQGQGQGQGQCQGVVQRTRSFWKAKNGAERLKLTSSQPLFPQLFFSGRKKTNLRGQRASLTISIAERS
jgi:hypothetical protein